MPRYGPDISHWQGSVDLARAKPHLDFVFLKATEGTGYVDPTFVPLSLTAIREDTKAIREKVEHL